MKVLVCGSRTITDYNYVERILEEILDDHVLIDLIISGGAKGPDSLAQEWAFRNLIPCQLFPAEWEKHGRSAGYRRNEQMLNELTASNRDIVIAFHDGQSKGTKHMIDISVKKGIPVIVFEKETYKTFNCFDIRDDGNGQKIMCDKMSHIK